MSSRQPFIPVRCVMRRVKQGQPVRKHREGIVCAVGRRRHGVLLILFENGRSVSLDMAPDFAQWLADQIAPRSLSACAAARGKGGKRSPSPDLQNAVHSSTAPLNPR